MKRSRAFCFINSYYYIRYYNSIYALRTTQNLEYINAVLEHNRSMMTRGMCPYNN